MTLNCFVHFKSSLRLRTSEPHRELLWPRRVSAATLCPHQIVRAKILQPIPFFPLLILHYLEPISISTDLCRRMVRLFQELRVFQTSLELSEVRHIARVRDVRDRSEMEGENERENDGHRKLVSVFHGGDLENVLTWSVMEDKLQGPRSPPSGRASP